MATASPGKLTAQEIQEPDGYVEIPDNTLLPARVRLMLETYSTLQTWTADRSCRWHMAGYRVREVESALLASEA